ncbi:Drug/Metabolite Transporter (DMT) Superfamily [Thraustotheca clavata]|uniref:Drug/Metabolite Transporter (DMT) Superfamily n=1 Tax=Thraustotheca clavata TaxID=74557 RepID=A0A1W0ABC4_9STRA|nr:Drug/Metabolite Transporter (DMT) Superfamily [Thraustotheca clavata]
MAKFEDIQRQIVNFAFGQFISVVLVTSNVFTQYLSNDKISLPTFQTLFLYGGLFVTLLPYHFYTKRKTIDLPWWYWPLFGLVDVEANYCAVLAYRGQSNLAILGLVLHSTIPFVTGISAFLLRKEYHLYHLIGCVLAIVGVTLIFFANDTDGVFPDQLRGNLYSLLAALLYAFSNLLQEFAVKHGGMEANIECLGKMGGWALIISIIQFYSVEYSTYKDVTFAGADIAYTFGYVFAMYVFYIVVSVFLRVTESLMFNLSLLTSDLYSALALRWFFGQSVQPLYWGAWAVEVVGIALYSIREPIQLSRDDPNWWLNRTTKSLGMKTKNLQEAYLSMHYCFFPVPRVIYEQTIVAFKPSAKDLDTPGIVPPIILRYFSCGLSCLFPRRIDFISMDDAILNLLWYTMDSVPRQFINAAFGQFISIIFVGNQVFSTYLSNDGASLPTFQSLFLYGGLACTFLPYHYIMKRPSMNLPWWYWALLGLVDVEANYCAVLAYRGQSNFAVMGLVLHMTIPFVTVLSYIFLRKVYHPLHLVGCALAIGGILLIFFANNSSGDYPDQLTSNLWSLLASLLYAVSNLLNEFAVKQGKLDANIESLGKMGAWGLIISIIQFYCVEYSMYKDVNFTGADISYVFGFVFDMYIFYAVVSLFLRVAESLMFNISLLTADLYSALAYRWFFGNSVPGLYWAAWAAEVVGIVLYSLREPKQLPHDESLWLVSYFNTAQIKLGLKKEEFIVVTPSLSNFKYNTCMSHHLIMVYTVYTSSHRGLS